MPASPIDLCLAADVAADLGVSADATVQRCVTAASAAIATYCGRTFERASLSEAPLCAGLPAAMLERPPVQSVTRVLENGAQLAASDFRVDVGAGLLRRVGRCWPLACRAGGFVSETTTEYESDGDKLLVDYVGGWQTPGQVALAGSGVSDLPADLQEAAVLTATQFYRRRGTDPNIASESLGDWSVTYAGTNTAIGRGGPIPDAARALLEPYVLRRAN